MNATAANDDPLSRGLSGLGRAGRLAERTSQLISLARKVSPVAVAIWLVAFAAIGWLTSIFAILALAFIAVLWFVAWLAVTNMLSSLTAMATGLRAAENQITEMRNAGIGLQQVPDELRRLLSSLGTGRLTLSKLRSAVGSARDGRQSLGQIRSISVASYMSGVGGLVLFGALSATGFLMLMIGVATRVI